MSESKHTAWEASGPGVHICDHTTGHAVRHVAFCDTPERAALIVRAVNERADLLAAAKEVLRGLNARIDAASAAKEPVPVFHGIADLAGAIARAEAAS